MNRSLKSIALSTAIVSLALSGCGGGGGSQTSGGPLVPQTPGIQQPNLSGPTTLSWGQKYVANSQYVGPASFNSLGLHVGVRMRDQAGLERYAVAASDRASGLYRHFLQPDEIADRFGATQADYSAAAKYFAGHGLHVGGWKQRDMLFVKGSQANLESAFHTKFGVYKRAGKYFVAPMTAPHLDSTTIPVTSVGLVKARIAHSYLIPSHQSNGLFRGYTPQQIQNGFDYTGPYQSGYNGAGITVGIIGTGPISPVDVPNFGLVTNAAVAKVTQVNVTDSGVALGLSQSGTPGSAYPLSTGLASPPPVTDSSQCPSDAQPGQNVTATCNLEDGEAQLDTEQVASLAPGSNVLFYLAFSPNECYQPGPGANPCPSPGPNAGLTPAIGVEGIGVFEDEVEQAIGDNRSDILSLSIGGGEIDFEAGGEFDSSGNGFGPTAFAELAAEGIATFVSSGDTGAYECSDPNTGAPLKCVSYPATLPTVTSVGGVTAPLNSFGQLMTQITGWGNQTTGGGDGTFANNVGSGGGVSSIFATPPYQQSLGEPFRAQPDVSLLADFNTGPALLANSFSQTDASYGPVGGTSVAAPQMAAMWALVLQACKASAACATAGGPRPFRLGNPNSLFYAIYNGTTPYASTSYAHTFYDVIYGDNSATAPSQPAPTAPPLPGYQASVGYDLVTGIGVPFGGHLINSIVTGQNVP